MFLMTSASATSKITSNAVSVIHITPIHLGVSTALTSLQPQQTRKSGLSALSLFIKLFETFR